MGNGYFVVSLDFEGLWGSIGGLSEGTVRGFANRVSKDDEVVSKLLALFTKYDIHCTWAVVGALACKDKDEVLALLKKDVRYDVWNLSIKEYVRAIDRPEVYFFPKLIAQVRDTAGQEIGSHTFIHFYANEKGATVDMLRQEMELSRKVMDGLWIKARTLIMPRNQVEGLDNEVLKDTGFTVVRGRAGGPLKPVMVKKVLNFADAYFPLIRRPFTLSDIGKDGIQNVKASILFRPYFKKLAFLEPLKLLRIKLAMKRAAKRSECFHLWFHPHNVANDMDRNFETLEKIFKYYQKLNIKYCMQSVTMAECAEKAMEYEKKKSNGGLYGLAHKLQAGMPWLWNMVELGNATVFSFQQRCCLKNMLPLLKKHDDRFTVREVEQKDVEKLAVFFSEQPEEAFTFFKPHGFDAKSLMTLVKRKSFLMFLVKDEEEIVGYFFLRCFANGNAFKGRIVDYRRRNQGIAKLMGNVINEVVLHLGLRLFTTISPENYASLASTKAVNDIKIVRTLENGYYMIECAPKKPAGGNFTS